MWHGDANEVSKVFQAEERVWANYEGVKSV
jgi:hypothetical protein